MQQIRHGKLPPGKHRQRLAATSPGLDGKLCAEKSRCCNMDRWNLTTRQMRALKGASLPSRPHYWITNPKTAPPQNQSATPTNCCYFGSSHRYFTVQPHLLTLHL